MKHPLAVIGQPNKPDVSALYRKAMKCRTKRQAIALFELLVQNYRSWNPTAGRTEAEKIVRTNLGYHAGYHGDDVRRRVEKLFDCEHPFFGRIADVGPVSAVRAFAIGVALGSGKAFSKK